MKIGIFGGTFDPFHIGHATIVKKALEKVDQVVIVPTICNYYRKDKRYLFTFEEKCAIITNFLTGFSDNVYLDKVEKDKDSNWRTVDTVKYFQQKYPNDELYLIIGEDSYRDFTTWFKYEDILQMAKLLVANRGLELKNNIPADLLDIGNNFEESSSSKVRDKLINELVDMYLLDKEYYGI